MKDNATIYDLRRCCVFYDGECSICPLKDLDCVPDYTTTKVIIDKTNEALLNWVAEHPVKTRQDVFLEQYPETDKDLQGIVDIAPCVISKKYRDMQEQSEDCGGKTCKDCFREYWLEEVE